jgi:hypothetical protein
VTLITEVPNAFASDRTDRTPVLALMLTEFNSPVVWLTVVTAKVRDF